MNYLGWGNTTTGGLFTLGWGGASKEVANVAGGGSGNNYEDENEDEMFCLVNAIMLTLKGR